MGLNQSTWQEVSLVEAEGERRLGILQLWNQEFFDPLCVLLAVRHERVIAEEVGIPCGIPALLVPGIPFGFKPRPHHPHVPHGVNLPEQNYKQDSGSEHAAAE